MQVFHRSKSHKIKSAKQDLRYSNIFDNEMEKKTKITLKPSKSFFISSDRYKNDFRDLGGLESQSVQELESYAAYKAEKTTKAVKSCLKLAESIREDAATTLVSLHQQREQITRTHAVAADMDHDLSRAAKLLRSLGGIFSTWKPKKTSPIQGPVSRTDDAFQKRINHMNQRKNLLMGSRSNGRSSTRSLNSEPADAFQKVEVEKAKQEDALSDICYVLDEIKEMALDMGLEFDRQNEALLRVHDDVDVLNYRLSQNNRRARYLLHK